MPGKHFLTVLDFSKSEIQEVLDLAIDLKVMRKARKEHHLLKGLTLAMVFQKPSNRTRVSFEVGIYELGGKSVNIRPTEIDMGKRESVPDVSRVMSRYVDAVMLRVLRHTDIQEFAEFSSVPVINGLSDLHHPCQALADILTIRERFGELKGLKLCYVGDGNNVCNSLIEIASLLDMEMVVSCPKGYEPTLNRNNGSYQIESDPNRAVMDSDVVYTDVWTSMGQEAETLKRLRVFKKYSVTRALMSKAKPTAIFMHCLPAHRGEEVEGDVVESPQSAIFDQAENRLHAQKALMVKLMSLGA